MPREEHVLPLLDTLLFLQQIGNTFEANHQKLGKVEEEAMIPLYITDIYIYTSDDMMESADGLGLPYLYKDEILAGII